MNKIIVQLLGLLLLIGIVGYDVETVESAGGALPPWPVIYSGSVTLGGEPAPDGLWVVGLMEGYTSVPLQVENGRIAGLAIGGPDTSYFNKIITFQLRADPGQTEGAVTAEETDVFMRYLTPTLKKDFDLTFPNFPTPTPFPTATPTVTPIPTSTPVATATPTAVGTVVYNGMVVASGGTLVDGSMLTARVGDYESNPVAVVGGSYISLIVDLDDAALTGETVRFFLNDSEARTTAIYEAGPTIRNVDLIFTDLPMVEPTPMPTAAVEIPAATPKPIAAVATVAPVPASVSEVVPTNTPIPTQIPAPTPEPVVVVVTATPAIEAETNESGGCMAGSDINPLTGTANVLAMIGPLLLLVAFRGYRRIF